MNSQDGCVRELFSRAANKKNKTGTVIKSNIPVCSCGKVSKHRRNATKRSREEVIWQCGERAIGRVLNKKAWFEEYLSFLCIELTNAGFDVEAQSVAKFAIERDSSK